MSDDEWGDLLDDLDNEPPLKAVQQLKNNDTELRLDTEIVKAPEKTVNFFISPGGDKGDKEPEMRPTARSSDALTELFGPSTGARASSGLGASTSAAPARRTGLNIDDIFGTAPRASAPSTNAPAASVAVPQQAAAAVVAAPADNFDAGRILRLEAELERVNRELEDTKRKKREDEEDLESMWKSKLDVQSRENAKTLEDLRAAHKSQITKLQEEHSIEIDRLKTNFDRQLENVTSSTSQVGDLVAVVGKVDSISSNIDRIAADVVASTNKVSSEQSAIMQLQEERLKLREEKLAADAEALKAEQLKVYGLNMSLTDLVKTQQNENEKEKWRTKEEWNRLKVERQLFKENQARIIENLQREKQKITEESNAFHKNQHDLLFRVSTERELLEQEKNEFFAKRDQDIKRIKAEAYELDLKSQQIATADQHVTEMKLVTEAKYRQLQHLETLLTSECAEIERLRNEQRIMANVGMSGAQSAFNLNLGESGRRQRRSREDELFGNNSNQNSHRRSESVRASLKKHYENLEKYAGQKVATVAPQNN
ncbi:hypothetical protein CAEBREN_10525 [Caenorhabditis brenneri]|uniref:Fas-binding factor 1 C-terminal domain-containing protein n=1 Tax=Caenorhabditis brenneri TaxID=135651 RepID=G0N0U1_CAEBE|nr:hypothetical protein CAEBREN_10525 [Caenorhabditis brenneri]